MTKAAKHDVPVTAGGREHHKPAHAAPLALRQPYEALEQFMETMINREWWPRAARWSDTFPELMMPFQLRRPCLDVVDEDDRVVVRAELPGVDKKDLKISINDHVLTITGTVGQDKKERRAHYYRREISRAEFDRSVELPRNIDSSKAEAKLSNGMLEVSIAKSAQSPRRTVEVK